MRTDSSLTDQELSEQQKKTRELVLSLSLFDVFSTDELDLLAQHMRYREILRNEHLFSEDEEGDYMCFVVRGLLDVLKKNRSGDCRVIARLGKGHIIGEMSIIDQRPRSATVIARQPSIVIILTKQDFETLTQEYPRLGVTLLKEITRLLSNNVRLTSSRLADTL